ncbi:mitotic-spindle organizing protein 2A [Trichonephila clavipes]|nr:mitotic-spindle organizing protein 2A [Trichonephila clavipes]
MGVAWYHNISNCWASYNSLKDEGFQHLKVNHSLTFMCPVTGAHTNSIEGSWSGIKRFLGNTTHRTEDMFDSYLHEFMWRRKNSHSVENKSSNVLSGCGECFYLCDRTSRRSTK